MSEATVPLLQQHLQRAWLRRGLTAWLLWPLSLLMRLVVTLRRAGYRAGWLASGHPGVPVIVVGNVVTGGAGKTPTVIAVVQHLQSLGYRPGVISRGWGRRNNDCRGVNPDSDPAEVGDEPLLIQRSTGAPVFVARKRLAAAKALLAGHPETDVVVCDDGLQHLALRRDLEICVFDERGIGNGFLLPAGLLREPWPRPVDLVLKTGNARSARGQTAIKGFSATRRLADHAIRSDGTRIALAELAQFPLLALAGIARPQAFFDMLMAAGMEPAMTQALPDHYDFSSWKAPADAGYAIICTEKDALKLWRVCPSAWSIALHLTPEAAFLQALDQRIVALVGPPLSSRHGHETA